jgi:hypothetical protein
MAAAVGSASAPLTRPIDPPCRLDRITEVHGRRHLLRSCALEFYFTDAHEIFLAFHTSKERASFYGKLTRQRTPLLITPRSLKPAEVRLTHSPPLPQHH